MDMSTLITMFDFVALPFMQRAFVGILILALLCGVFGVFVILRRMAFFADAIAHSSLAGIAIGILLGISPNIATLAASLLVASGIAFLMSRTKQSLDTIIGIAYAIALSVGVMLISISRGVAVNINSFLFGDILSVDWKMILTMAIVTVFVLAILYKYWRAFVLMSLQSDLAAVQGIKVNRMEWVFMLLLAASVAVGIRIAGIILIGPLLIIPAATAKNVSRSLRETVFLSVIFSMISGTLGLFASYVFNVPSGPTIIIASGLLFFASLIKK
ncbi:MAG: metal ABC transporter permease [bacterium]